MSGEPVSIKGYQFLEKIGSGGFGEVWRAKDLRSDETVAIKILKLNHHEPEYLSLFKSEFQILSQLRHVNLARVHDFGYSQEAGVYYFSSEYCLGSTFHRAIVGKPVAFIEEILRQILSALDYIHSQGIVHLDLKPENILVHESEGKPHVKLLDFGVASRIQRPNTAVGGTPAYMAPELFLPELRFDHRADLYSLGMISLLALVGKLPFDPANRSAVIKWHLKGTLPQSIRREKKNPPQLVEITEKLLMKKPSDRFSNARVVLNFLNLATGQRPRDSQESYQPLIPEEGPLVERKKVLSETEKRIQSALFTDHAEATSSVCFFSGEKGIGKSRILSEVRQRIELEEIPVLQIDCDEQTSGWQKIFDWLTLSDSRKEIREGDGKNLGKIHFLLNAAKKKPFCLLIDNFHLADREFKNLITELAERTLQARAQGEKNPLFVAVTTEEKTKDAISLPRLTLNGVESYLKQLFGDTEGLEGLAKVLHKYSGGLPLLMVEGLRYLAPHWKGKSSLENLLPPPEIGNLYGKKMAQLNSEEEELIHILALILRPVSITELTRIVETDLDKLFRLSQKGIHLGLLHENSPGIVDETSTLQIASQALSMSLIQALDSEKKKNLHLKIARGIEEAKIKNPQEIAFHLGKGGEKQKAVQFYREASEDLKKNGQIGSAAECLIKSIPLADEKTSTWEELVLETSRLLIQSGAYQEAETYLVKLAGHSSFDYEKLLGWLHFKQRKLDSSRKHYQKALSLLPKGDLLSQILLENAIGNIDLQEGKYQEAATRFQETLNLEKELTADKLSEIHNNHLGLARTMLGEGEGALAFYRERIKSLEKFPDEEEERTLLSGMAFVYLNLSRYDEAIAALKKAMALAEQSGAMHSLFSTMGNLSTALNKVGRYAESLSLIQKMVNYQRRLGSSRDLAYNLLREGGVYLTLGMIEVAEEQFHKGEETAKLVKDYRLFDWFVLMEGYAEREKGNFDKARSMFEKLEEEAKKSKLAELASWTSYAMADLAFEEGKIEECARLIQKIPANSLDQEFRTRLHLLQAKTESSLKKCDPDPLFSPVETECVQQQLREILWEVYHAWGRASKKIHGADKARQLFENGVNVLQFIARPLPEEFRDRYLKQKNRKKLQDDYQELVFPAPKGIAARMRSFIKDRIGHALTHRQD